MFKKLLSNIVFRNFSYLTIGSVIGQLISVLTVIKITSAISPGDYGLYTFLISQGLLLVKIGNLGNTNIIIRSVARNPYSANNYLVNTSFLRFASVIVLTVFYIAYNFLFGSLTLGQLVLIFLFSMVNCFSNLFEWIFTGNQKILPISIINLFYNVLWLTIIFIIPLRETSAAALFGFYTIANSIKCGILYTVMVRNGLNLGEVTNFWQSIASLIKESWPYLMMILIMLPLTNLTNNFLDLNSTNEELGYFNLAQRFVGPVGLVITMMLTALFPNLAILWEKDPAKFRTNIGKGFRVYMLVSAFGCFMFTIFSEDLITALFPSGYYHAIIVCQIQVWYVFLTSIDSFIGTILGATNMEKLILRFAIIYFIVCTPSLFYGSFFGARGLSLAYVASFGLVLIYGWVVFQKKLGLRIEKELETVFLVALLGLLSFISVSYFDFIQKVILFVFVLVLFSIYCLNLLRKMRLA